MAKAIDADESPRVAVGLGEALADTARAHLVTVGRAPAYGSRPLKRAIQREIETPLGRLLLKGEVRDGQHVVADYQGGEGLTFTARQQAPWEEPVGARK